jgi:hypothetical protein
MIAGRGRRARSADLYAITGLPPTRWRRTRIGDLGGRVAGWSPGPGLIDWPRSRRGTRRGGAFRAGGRFVAVLRGGTRLSEGQTSVGASRPAATFAARGLPAPGRPAVAGELLDVAVGRADEAMPTAKYRLTSAYPNAATAAADAAAVSDRRLRARTGHAQRQFAHHAPVLTPGPLDCAAPGSHRAAVPPAPGHQVRCASDITGSWSI